MTVDRELISSALPAYDLGDELGRGGGGVVVSGWHRQLHRQVAIKQLPVALAADPAVRRRFTAEARVLASLDHPHVVPVFDFVEREGLCLLVMELLPGGTLRSRADAVGGFTVPHAVAVALACASGLGAAHHGGILHRDVKPENMLFAASGIIKVTDFGIAKIIGDQNTILTRVGDVLGTPAYIAPEQIRGGGLSPATDVYGLATMLYELLAGTLPFPEDGDHVALLFRHAYETPVPLRDAAPTVPDPVAAVVMRALQTEPTERFATAESFGVALAEACSRTWGPGWLSAEGVPVMGSAPIISAAEHPFATPREAPPASLTPPGPQLPNAREVPLASAESAAATVRPSAPPPATDGDSGAVDQTPAEPHRIATHTKTTIASQGHEHLPRPSAPIRGDGGTAARPETADATPRRSRSIHRRRLVVAIIVAVILIATIATLVFLKPFTVDRSSSLSRGHFGSWAAAPPLLRPVEAAGTATFANRVWVLGGNTPSVAAVSDVQIYDPTNNRWSYGQPLPMPLHDVVAVSTGSALYAVGGETADHRVMATTYRLDAPSGTWLTDTPLPQARAAGAGAWDGSRLVYAGGIGPDQQDRGEVWAFAGGQWSDISALTLPRDSLGAATDGNGTVWFLAGQRSASQPTAGPNAVPSGRAERLGGSKLTRLPDVRPRRAVAAVYANGAGPCLIGGAGPGGKFDPVVECPLAAPGVTPPPLLTPRAGLGAATLGTTAYAVGGFWPDHSNGSVTVETLAIPG